MLSKEEILAGNTAIGVFMGAQFVNDAPDDYPNGYYTGIEYSIAPGDWQYHTDWHWLFEAIDKIEVIANTNVVIMKGKCQIHSFGADNTTLSYAKLVENDSKIQATWLAVIDFITWYNAQSK